MEEDTNILSLRIRKINIVKIYILLCRFNAIPIKIQMAFFTEIEQAILQCVWNHTISQIVNEILRKRIKIEASCSLISNYSYSNQSYSDQNSMVVA